MLRTVFLLLLLASAAQAQPAPDLRRVVLVDGTTLVGIVEDESADPVVVRMRDGIEQRIPRARVAEIAPLAGGRFARVDPTRTRTLLSPTGRTLGAGAKRVGTFLYVVPSVSAGVTDRVDLSGTAVVAFGGDAFVLPVLGAKVGLVDTGTFAAALGTTVALPTGGGETAVAVTPYAAATLGGDLRSATLGVTAFLGGRLGEGDVEAADGVLFQVAGASQVSDRVKLLGEVLLPVFDEDGTGAVAFLPGVRVFGDAFSVDVYGVLGIREGAVGGFAPFANFAYTF